MNDTPAGEGSAVTPPPQPAPPSGPPSASTGWYTGPFPPPGVALGRESLGRAILRAVIMSGATVITVGVGLAAAVFVMAIMGAAIMTVLAGGAGAAEQGVGQTAFVDGKATSRNRLLLIEVKGPILGVQQDSQGLLSNLAPSTYGYEIKRQLKKAAEDKSIKGVVLELDTPGGTIYGSQAIADGVREYQEATGKPVLAFVAGLSASGGMWAMAPATKVLADHGSLVGSIGVTMGTLPYYNGVTATEGGLLGGGVTTANGIEYTTITAGRGKDMGSPYRRLTDEERAVLQQGVNRSYDAFVRHIAASRRISEADVRSRVGALVYDNDTAQELGLIDGTADRQEAFAEAAKLADLPEGDWRVVRRKKGLGALGSLLSRFRGPAPQASLARPGVCFAQHAVLAYYGDPAALCGGR